MPPSVVATVMVRQRLGGLSDREAVERFASRTAGGTRRAWSWDHFAPQLTSSRQISRQCGGAVAVGMLITVAGAPHIYVGEHEHSEQDT